ncbi:MAG: MFS transporter, partial [Proteobacteria bacterium]|nr:MFS transporter [Pseudomonadota bacterium]
MHASTASGRGLDRRTVVLALASFAIATESYVFVGHLGALAADLSVEVPAAGQLASIFAVTYALTGPLTARVMARFDRRTVLTIGLVLIGLLNLSASLASSYAALMTIRCLCGLAAGLVGPMASTAAADLAGPEQRGKAIAIVLSGMTIALVVGIPVGTLIGAFGGWRGTFIYAGLLAIGSAVAIRFVLPAVPGAALSSGSAARAALSPAVGVCLLLTLISYTSGFVIAIYVAPLVVAICGLSATGVGAIQALGGV